MELFLIRWIVKQILSYRERIIVRSCVILKLGFLQFASRGMNSYLEWSEVDLHNIGADYRYSKSLCVLEISSVDDLGIAIGLLLFIVQVFSQGVPLKL